ncbi:hypothetical protein VMCG_05574 [Cytospora schulzeri]|uniref:F-box domain-containing protein n=1 Tax=Cytospora schulzeri TaxID=448051 RepID=A0A423WFA8_9PEZI|nr:hypothetical protein VMCG_05574 [Valsa malicola]
MQSQDHGLASLPPELLNNIARPLSTKDFNALRSSCKPIEDKLFPYWANCFFKKRQFMIDQFSLQTLVHISQHNALSKVMTHLVIGLDEFRAISSASIQRDVLEYGQWRAAAAGQDNLVQTGVAIDLLSTALANLPNLKTIDVRDFNSPTRYRDSVGQQAAEWRSYGWSRYGQWKHAHAHYHPYRTKEFIGHVFKAVLTALDRCSPDLDSLEVVLRNRRHSLVDDAFAFSPALGPGLTKTLHSLKKLHLDLVCQGNLELPPTVGTNAIRDFFDPLTAYTRSFLGYTKNVTWLRLNFSHTSVASRKFLKWLSLKPDCNPQLGHIGWTEMNPAPVALPLRRLDLGSITVQPEVLHKVLAKFPDLESLYLRGATLELEDRIGVHSLLDDDGAYDDGSCVWARFIRGLPVSAPSLKHLTLTNVQQVYGRHVGVIIFCSGESREPLDSQSVTGIDKDKTKLEQLADITWTQALLFRMRKAEAGVVTDDEDEDLDDLDEDDDQDQDSEVENDEEY